MDIFEEYLQQGEPNKREKVNAWNTAIGLQEVDGIKPSDYLIQTAKQNIEGNISIEEAKQQINNYYQQQNSKNEENRTEEADKVSVRIAEILGENTFSFSPIEYISIHRRLFEGIYPHAGKIRTYNITKAEWVLNGETVIYASAENLKQTLDYDFAQEKIFSYKGLNKQQIVEHIAHFISYLWQIHIFGEGNTRTTAVFLIKYLRKLGFKQINNDMFARHSWFFRNALVRANYEDLSQGIHKTDVFLIRFLSNLLLGENHMLRNREMHVHFEPVNTQNEPVNDPLLLLIQKQPNITIKQISEILKISISTAKRRIQAFKEKGVIYRVGSDKTGIWKLK
ncbi:Fic family protein [Capnocytophaga canis]|uniref:protein adenylyltransferase n=1 Tax=Capnocytophaga canis TaxID=1848903 RepID=A0A0B7IWT6_9FLAO|nr:Fic family protein [Capnocytophaga canis]CEN54552.1 HTH domain protein [Capnocytophaga canis]